MFLSRDSYGKPLPSWGKGKVNRGMKGAGRRGRMQADKISGEKKVF